MCLVVQGLVGMLGYAVIEAEISPVKHTCTVSVLNVSQHLICPLC